MKKKLILMGIAGALVLSTMVGGTLAAFQANSSQGTSKIETKDLKISLSEDASELAKYYSGDLRLMPGAEVDTNLTVSTDANNYESYIRVTVFKAWGSGIKDTFSIDDSLDHGQINITSGDGWIVKTIDNQTTVLYYTKPVAGGVSTPSFISKVGIPATLTNDYADKQFTIEAYAEAVQTMGGVEAIKSAWGVDAVIDGSGDITTIEGQSLWRQIGRAESDE